MRMFHVALTAPQPEIVVDGEKSTEYGIAFMTDPDSPPDKVAQGMVWCLAGMRQYEAEHDLPRGDYRIEYSYIEVPDPEEEE